MRQRCVVHAGADEARSLRRAGDRVRHGGQHAHRRPDLHHGSLAAAGRLETSTPNEPPRPCCLQCACRTVFPGRPGHSAKDPRSYDGGLCFLPGAPSLQTCAALVGPLPRGDALERAPGAGARPDERGAGREIANATARRETANAQWTTGTPLPSLDCVHLIASRRTSYYGLHGCPHIARVTAGAEVFGFDKRDLDLVIPGHIRTRATHTRNILATGASEEKTVSDKSDILGTPD